MQLQRSLRQAVHDLVGTGLTESAWAQSCLPIAPGGLGVSDLVVTRAVKVITCWFKPMVITKVIT